MARKATAQKAMRVGVISDTHVPEAGPDIPAEAYDALAGSDLILHCGDLHIVDILDRLERIAPVIAARGNGDPLQWLHDLRPGVPEDPRIEETHILELAGWSIGMTHDLESVVGRSEEFADDWVLRAFGERVDIAVFGHTHIPLTWGLAAGTALINPGSPTLPYGYRKVLGTVGMLELGSDAFSFEVIDLATGTRQLQMSGPGPSPMQQGPRPIGGK